MKILSWNILELGNPLGIRFLQDLILKEGPDIVFSQEIKTLARAMENKKHMLGYVKCFAIDCKGRGGGLAILWSRDVIHSIRNFLEKSYSYYLY